MKPLSHHVNKVKAQPHHIRKRVAFMAAFATAAVIALIWAGASLATGAFAIKGSNFAESTGAETTSGIATNGSNTDLTASAAEAGNAGSQPAGIEIVDAPTHSTSSGQAANTGSSATVIPF
jgi:hypothetical protein